jgi:hypothetical protein
MSRLTVSAQDSLFEFRKQLL